MGRAAAQPSIKRFKDAAAAMSVLEIERLYQLKRGNIAEEMHQLGEHYAEGTEIQSVSIFKIMSSFERIIKKLNLRSNEMQHVVVKYNYSMETQRKYIIEEMKEKKRASFEQVFSVCEDRIHAIFTFLAILEMVQQKFISILTTENYNSFMLEWNNIEVPNEAPSFNSGF